MLRRSLAILGSAALLAAVGAVAQPSPPSARANIVCDVGSGAADAVTGGMTAIVGAIGGGNPVGDVCASVSDGAVGAVTSPVTDALKGIGNGIFDQVTTWVAQGTSWLIERVVAEIEKTTTPKLTGKGFLAEYGQMAEIAAVLAAAMFLLAVFEAVAQGSWGLLGRVVFVNVPVAFIATSVAFAVVQLLLVATDGMCHAIAAATHDHSERFFKSAIKGLSEAGGSAGAAVSPGDPASKAVGGAAGATAVPVFVVFLAAIVGAFAAFFVWLEMLARDAAVYVVALFMPMALAASIWPRWSGALRRTAELLVVVIASKFVIVSIIALAAGLAAQGEGEIEPLLAASALMLLACFSPLMLLKLVPFAEGAMGAAYGRRSASGGAMTGLQLTSEVHMLRSMARSHWGSSSPPEVWNVSSGTGGPGNKDSGGGSPTPHPGGRGGGGGGAVAGGAAGGEAAAGAASPATAGKASPGAAAASAPLAVGQGARAGARRLEQSGAAGAGADPASRSAGATGSEGSPRKGGASETDAPTPSAPSPGEKPPRPPQELPGKQRKGVK